MNIPFTGTAASSSGHLQVCVIGCAHFVVLENRTICHRVWTFYRGSKWHHLCSPISPITVNSL
uniref:Uncharacterized protein n=1 Tax=Anguilla anguilla TaxID=7936 RepID=A0A0E9QMF1_ANGAN